MATLNAKVCKPSVFTRESCTDYTDADSTYYQHLCKTPFTSQTFFPCKVNRHGSVVPQASQGSEFSQLHQADQYRAASRLGCLLWPVADTCENINTENSPPQVSLQLTASSAHDSAKAVPSSSDESFACRSPQPVDCRLFCVVCPKTQQCFCKDQCMIYAVSYESIHPHRNPCSKKRLPGCR